mmetsp:Transcript_2351/g.8621  ORF Transcript_2351/g.8621 Transcript_2351/m.8621 type:complete len:249 (-) Transcript_2351:617-1363(-)
MTKAYTLAPQPTTAITFSMCPGLIFLTTFAICSACSLDMFIPACDDTAASVSASMFCIIFDTLSATFGLAISLAAFSGSGAPPGPIEPSISFAIEAIDSMSSGVMFSIILAAILAISGVISGTSSRPVICFIAFICSASCSGDNFSISAAACFIMSGFSFIIFIMPSMSGGPPPGIIMPGGTAGGAGAGGISTSGTSSTLAPEAWSTFSASSSAFLTASSFSLSSCALRRSATAAGSSPAAWRASPRR